MNKTIYFEKLFTNPREKLLDYCSELQKNGKNLGTKEASCMIKIKYRAKHID